MVVPNCRNLVCVFDSMTKDHCKTLNLKAVKTIRNKLRVPMVVITLCSGLLAATGLSFLKGALIFVKNEGFLGGFLPSIFSIISLTLNFIQLVLLNKMMAIYDQIDISPIY